MDESMSEPPSRQSFIIVREMETLLSMLLVCSSNLSYIDLTMLL